MWLKHNKSLNKISSFNKKLKYFVSSCEKPIQKNPSQPSNYIFKHFSLKFSFSPPTNVLQPDFTVDISFKIETNPRTLLEPKPNWFINLTNISTEVTGLLQLGDNFCLLRTILN